MLKAIKFRLPIVIFLAVLISCPPVYAHRDRDEVAKKGVLLLVGGLAVTFLVASIVTGIVKENEKKAEVTLENMLPTALSGKTTKEKSSRTKQVQLEFNMQAFDLSVAREDHYNGSHAYTDRIQNIGLLITIPFN